ncbi:Tol-Pal system beta propeller repeat protein TolB [Methyloversatilis sp.]|uniref:Tol-Pal system beta propeller repeat protein TolB n=1 Tax=Methyloversatilis sp. TaxID=2569862 RepID=UPI002735E5FB|nr:Tol-Pal system beta propeller repeat protein TolB [Methyloversatilis sp.]MDP2870421.1 Tol-Pal system beta propeller repeat protein TolB [Methyloversatilis sp.]MDP3453976.1 Tol-Pal system beta propeller repeat protein TolB [Methyloversatilis sp.]MDP3578772.1 Tol-Pal system beta propeller repeat protein TolB [Methyloversatilis sp.]
MFKVFRLMATTLLLAATAAQAQLTVEITGAGANRIPVAIANFAGDGLLPQALTGVVRADLERSGLFKLVDPGTTPVPENAAIDLNQWKDRGADALALASILPAPGGRYEVRMRLYDIARQNKPDGMIFLFGASTVRETGHRIADFIHEKLTGERGVYSTRIAYVVKTGKSFELKVDDADGQNPRTALRSSEPIISPAWSPDGTRLAYVSFQAKKPIIYVHSLATGAQTVVANFKGSNSAPAWSPDGKRLAVVLTKDGSSQIYTINPDGSGLSRIAGSSTIDTEPQFSPDGQYLYFTSDRGGSPQIYRVAAAGGTAERVTFEGSYNVSPRLSPDGKLLAYVSRNGGRFQVTVMDLASRQIQILTDSSRDESPSFAPNSRTILYASEVGGRGVLSAVSSDGRVKQKLSGQAGGDVREPAWGPFNQP